MNINFLLGVVTTLLFTTAQGRGIYKSVTGSADSLTSKALKFGLETVKEAMPNVAKIITPTKKTGGEKTDGNEQSTV